MICPKCRTDTLHLATVGATGVRLDRCSGCGGTWLDYGEVVPAAEDPRLPLDARADPSADARSGPCPRCAIELRQTPFPDGPFHVDRCPRCGGVFLDRGELAEIASRHLVDPLEHVLAPRRAAAPQPIEREGGLALADRAVLARAADLAARYPDAAAFLRAHLDGLPHS